MSNHFNQAQSNRLTSGYARILRAIELGRNSLVGNKSLVCEAWHTRSVRTHDFATCLSDRSSKNKAESILYA